MLYGFFLIQIKPGNNNLIALTATKIDADVAIENVEPERRKCLFADENKNLTIHKKYSMANCVLECSLLFAQNQLLEKKDISERCTPWFFPVSDDQTTICNPWEANLIMGVIQNYIPENICAHCLPDCSTVIYQSTLTALEFRFQHFFKQK
jgi:hypothetical protein